MSISVRILGSSGGLPTRHRWTTSQLLQWENHAFLIDCGEGCQMRLNEYFPKIQKIQHIFISHLHGDHIFGLPGLLSSYTLNRRSAELHIYGPLGLRKWLESALAFDVSLLSFILHIHEFEVAAKCQVLELPGVCVTAIPMDHRVPCHGYIFQSSKDLELNIRVEKIHEHNLSHEEIQMAKMGKEVNRGEERLPPNVLCYPPERRSYAFCTDTKYFDDLSRYLEGVENIYMECTYDSSLQDLAIKNHHCSTADVVRLASEVSPRRVIVGHFSARYGDTGVIQKELGMIPSEVYVSEDGMEIPLS